MHHLCQHRAIALAPFVLLCVAPVFIGISSAFAQVATPPEGWAPPGDKEVVYEIGSLDNLYWLSQTPDAWDESFKLTDDINAAETSDWDSGAGFSPIGNETAQFTGSFDGQGHAIAGLTINPTPPDDIGMFGYTSDASSISNLGIEGVSVTGCVRSGGLVGKNNGGMITGSYVTGTVTGGNHTGGLVGYNDEGTITACYAACTVSGGTWIGGLVRQNMGGAITACYATGTVSGSGSEIGGLAGRNDEGTITACYATGEVSGWGWAGGLVGNNVDSAITKSYAAGEVSSQYYYAGGLVGDSNGPITKCYATGDVSGATWIGGLVGCSTEVAVTTCYATGAVTGTTGVGGLAGGLGGSSGTIEFCYAAGEVTGSADVGGIVGKNSDATVSKCYWDVTPDTGTGQAVAVGSGPAATETYGLTTMQMTDRSSFGNFTFDANNWAMFGGRMPYLAWQDGSAAEGEGEDEGEGEGQAEGEGAEGEGGGEGLAEGEGEGDEGESPCVDVEGPVARCRNATVNLSALGSVAVTAPMVDAGSTDDCGIVRYTVSPNLFTCDNLGANEVTLTVRDAAGNVDTCTAVVTITDTLNSCGLAEEGEDEGEGSGAEGEDEGEDEGEVSEGEIAEGEVEEGEVAEGEAVEGEVEEGEIAEGEGEEGEAPEGEGVDARIATLQASLLDQFEALDANGDGALSFSEAQARFADLTQEEFDTLDQNGNGLLSRTELGGTEPVSTGCTLFEGNKSLSGYLGDLLLLGLSLTVLSTTRRSWARRG